MKLSELRKLNDDFVNKLGAGLKAFLQAMGKSCSGVVALVIAAMCKMSPLELVKRASVPSILGLIAHHIFVFWLSL